MDYNIRKEWSKVIQDLNDIDINDKKCNKNPGNILYATNSTKISSPISNIVTVLTKICSSTKNNIEETYINLFDRDAETDNVSKRIQEFFKLIVNKSVDLECIGEDIIVKDDIMYGKLKITKITNNNKKFKRQISYTFDKNGNTISLINKDSFDVGNLEKISFQIKNDKDLNALDYIVINYVDKLKKRTFDRHHQTNNLRLFNKDLLISNFNKEDYLHYLIEKFIGTNQESKILNIVEMVVKSALEDNPGNSENLLFFYILIDDLRSDLSEKEVFEIWVKLLNKFNPAKSKNLFKLWNKKIDKIEIKKEWCCFLLQSEEKYKYACKILGNEKAKNLKFLKKK